MAKKGSHEKFLNNFKGALVPLDELTSRLTNGTATVHEALMYTLHKRGIVIPEEFIEAVRKTDPAKALEYENIANDFPPLSSEPFQVGTFENYLRSLDTEKRALLDESYFDVTRLDNLQKHAVAGGRLPKNLSASLSNIDKYVFSLPDDTESKHGRKVQLSSKTTDLMKQPRNTKQFTAFPSEKQVYKGLMNGVKNIPDPEIRRAIFLALIYPSRATSHSETTLNEQTSRSRMGRSQQVTAARPFLFKDVNGQYSLNMPFEEITDTQEKARLQGIAKKAVMARVIPGDLLQILLDEQSKYILDTPDIVNKNYLFTDKVDIANLTKEIGKYIEPEFENLRRAMQGRTVRTIGDIRKIVLSSMADSLGMTSEAHQLSGHTITAAQVAKYQSEMLGKVYVTPFDTAKVDTNNKALLLMEHHVANMLGFDDLIDMAGPDGFDIIDDSDILKNVKITTLKPSTKNLADKINQDTRFEEKVLTSSEKNNIEDKVNLNKENRKLRIEKEKESLLTGIEEDKALREKAKYEKEIIKEKRLKLKDKNEDVVKQNLKKIETRDKEVEDFLNDMFDDAEGDTVDDGKSNIGHNKPPTNLERRLTEGIERLTSPSTYTNIAENVVDAAGDIETYKKMGSLALGAVNPFNKLKYIYKGGKMLLPGSKTEGSLEVSVEGADAATRSFREEQKAIIEARKMQEQMGDMDYSMEQNKSLIGDDKLETTEEKLDRQMFEAGFGS